MSFLVHPRRTPAIHNSRIRHGEHLVELTPAEAAALGPVVRDACGALAAVLAPAKVYVASFGDGVQYIHFWLLPRPRDQRSGLHWVLLHLDLRLWLARPGFRRWVALDEEVAGLAARLRHVLGTAPPPWGQTVPDAAMITVGVPL